MALAVTSSARKAGCEAFLEEPEMSAPEEVDLRVSLAGKRSLWNSGRWPSSQVVLLCGAVPNPCSSEPPTVIGRLVLAAGHREQGGADVLGGVAGDVDAQDHHGCQEGGQP